MGELSGKKHDGGKLRYDLIAPEGLEGLVQVLTFGALKYSDRNWEKGFKWGRLYAALMRHMWAWWKGEDNDPETGLSHLHHAACCIHFLQTHEARHLGEDDRPKQPIGEIEHEISITSDDISFLAGLCQDRHVITQPATYDYSKFHNQATSGPTAPPADGN
jgi:hypothetical protein